MLKSKQSVVEELQVADVSHKISVMQAFKDGKDVKISIRTGEYYVIANIRNNKIEWNWQEFEYEIYSPKLSINWDHVDERFNFLTLNKTGVHVIYEKKPVWNDSFGWSIGDAGGTLACAEGFKSLVSPPGLKPCDSLICRNEKAS